MKINLKVLIFLIAFIFSAGVDKVSALSATIKQHLENKPSKLVFSKLTINPASSQQSIQPLHFCPVHGRIMKGAFCKMKHASANDPESDSKDKEKCFISIDDVGHPSASIAEVLQLEYKFVAYTLAEMRLILPGCIFNVSEFKIYSQEYFNTPDKPPEYHF